MTTAAYFSGQVGDPQDDPQADTTLQAIHQVLDHLGSAALFADDPDLTAHVEATLGEAEMTAAGFEPGSDEAEAVELLIGAILRNHAEVKAEAEVLS